MNTPRQSFQPGLWVDPSTWETINRRLIAKLLGEFAHERLLNPEAETDTNYVVRGDSTDAADVEYRFSARRWALDHWEVDPSSIVRLSEGKATALDGLQAVLDARDRLDLGTEALAAYLEELCAGLYADVYKHNHQRFDAPALARAQFHEIEAAMTAGHPCFVANAGRIGFDTEDHKLYAPEASPSIRLLWLAARSDLARFRAVEDVDYDSLLRRELGDETRASFEGRLRAASLDPSDYIIFPVHPWQWTNRLSITLAGDLARRELVYLGESEDSYQPQQSIRTLYNLSNPGRCYVKTALSIVNMGFVRGLSPQYMEGTPAINQWVDELVSADETLSRLGFSVLRELATVGYRTPTFASAAPASSHYNKMVAALWRESPWERGGKGHRLLTMAALLHVDRDGAALLPHLVHESGIGADNWLKAYLRVYLTPLLHCFYAHKIVFMPHGENVILGLKAGVPALAFMKDIAEEVALLGDGEGLPAAVRRIAMDVPEDLHLLSIFTDVFDCFFRFLVPIVARDCGVSEPRFWRLVAGTILEYQHNHPQFAERYERHDLFAPRFKRSCINRLQLRNSRQIIDLADPAGALQFEGELVNPIAQFGAAKR